MVKFRGSRAVCYRSVRVGSKVRSVYLGCGPAAVALAGKLDSIKREIKIRRAADEAVEAELTGWFRAVERAVRAALEGTGYRLHNRGEWRRLRMVKRTELAAVEPGRVLAEAEACHRLDRSVAAARVGGNLAGHVIDATLKGAGIDNPLLAEATRRRVDQVRRDLAGPDPTPAEAILAERAAVCWLAVYLAEWSATAVGEESIAALDYRQRKADAANRRFLASVRTLMVVRKLGVPGLQVNIDARSVRLATPDPPAEGIDDGRVG